MKLYFKLIFVLCFIFQNILIFTKPNKKESFRNQYNLHIEVPTTITGFDRTPLIKKQHDNLDLTLLKIIVVTLAIGAGVQFYQNFQNRSEKSIR